MYVSGCLACVSLDKLPLKCLQEVFQQLVETYQVGLQSARCLVGLPHTCLGVAGGLLGNSNVLQSSAYLGDCRQHQI